MISIPIIKSLKEYYRTYQNCENKEMPYILGLDKVTGLHDMKSNMNQFLNTVIYRFPLFQNSTDNIPLILRLVWVSKLKL